MTELESALDAQPGTNLKGTVGGANWCFLLPSLELGQVLCLGCPSFSSLVTLSKLAGEVAVWASIAEHDRVHGLIAKLEPQNVTALVAEGSHPLRFSDSAVDIVFVADPGLARSELAGGGQAEIRRVLKPDGFLYVESYPTVERWLRRPKPEASFDRIGGRTPLWLGPAFDEMRFAASSRDARAIEFLEGRFLKPIIRRELVKRPRRVLSRSVRVNRALRRRGLLASGVDGGPTAGPPAYVRAIATRAGTSVEGERCALAAPGDYGSQKVLLFLFGEERGQPHSVVKITREPRFNSRLENEWRALTFLQERGIGQDGTCPWPLFLGYEAGLAVLGETAISGVPFVRPTQAGAKWQHARGAVEWLAALGAATAHSPEDFSTVRTRVQGLLDQFDDLYRPPGETSRFLAGQAEAIEAADDDMRLVFQHGDPGPWNLLVTPEGRPAFLDWEAADPDGIPLWDLFHFLRSFGFSLLPKRRKQDALQSFADHVLSASELNHLLVETTARYCAETSLSPRLVEPLFYLCWMHRAVKEAARLPHDRLQSGRYFNLLRFAVERREAPGLQRLFTLPAAA